MNLVRGFSLIEMAVVLIVLVLLLGGALVPLSTQVEQRKIAETEKAIEEAKEALIGFALANSRLPCPDNPPPSVPPDGVSDPTTGGNCSNDFEGVLPWVTLKVAGADAWGRRFRYRVSPEFTDVPAPTCATGDGKIGLCDSGVINVTTKDATKTSQSLVTGAAAIVISHGKNGFSATTETNVALPNPPASNVDENANIAGPNYFSRTITPLATPCSDAPLSASAYCEFDDILIWLSPNVLFNRMVAAQRLP
ncbi:MAG: prepilin-type N-terminal cleavage/methylation domain-containing protein [Pyrinomonadaceae bacterium]